MVRVLVTGTESFTHYMTIAPVLYSFWKRHGISEILTPGKRDNGIDCAAKIFAQVNSIPLTVQKNIDLIIPFASAAIIFWDETEGEIMGLIEHLERRDINVHVESIQYREEKWFDKFKKKGGWKPRGKPQNLPQPSKKIDFYKSLYEPTVLTRDPRPTYQVIQDVKQIKLPKNFDRSVLLKDLL